MGMLSAVRGKQFFIECYNPVGEMMDMMALTNSAVNFILYCVMSSQFRNTGKKLLGIHKKQAITSIRRMSVKLEVRSTRQNQQTSFIAQNKSDTILFLEFQSDTFRTITKQTRFRLFLCLRSTALCTQRTRHQSEYSTTGSKYEN